MKTCIGIIIEEAPRVLGKDVLDKGINILVQLQEEKI